MAMLPFCPFGMTRAAAINRATAGAEKLWAGTVEIHSDPTPRPAPTTTARWRA